MVFASEVLCSFLRRKQIATLEELKQALGTASTMTVFRKLKTLGYRTSYSHRGKYYTLPEIPQFDEPGLWSCRGVWFSRDGNLLATAQRFVEESNAGLAASELQAVLNVEVKEPFLQLYQRKRVDRREIGGLYVYFSREPGGQREQRLRREARPAAVGVEEAPLGAEPSPELKYAVILLFRYTVEGERRVCVGLVWQKL